MIDRRVLNRLGRKGVSPQTHIHIHWRRLEHVSPVLRLLGAPSTRGCFPALGVGSRGGEWTNQGCMGGALYPQTRFPLSTGGQMAESHRIRRQSL
jgi:hypothetical protein